MEIGWRFYHRYIFFGNWGRERLKQHKMQHIFPLSNLIYSFWWSSHLVFKFWLHSTTINLFLTHSIADCNISILILIAYQIYSLSHYFIGQISYSKWNAISMNSLNISLCTDSIVANIKHKYFAFEICNRKFNFDNINSFSIFWSLLMAAKFN